MPKKIDSTTVSDEETLKRLGYKQELQRGMSGFSNFAISMSIICILAGGVTSFHQGLCAVGGIAYGVGWPLVCLFSLVVAMTMGHVASAFPTAGGLYHWASILGGKGWGWGTAWLNLLGLVAALSAIDVGVYLFTLDVLTSLGVTNIGQGLLSQFIVVSLIILSQAWINHAGIRLTTKLTDFSGYWILFIACFTIVVLFVFSPTSGPP